MGEEIVQSYIRIAPADGFLCNEHQGGRSIYIKLSDIPERVLNRAYSIIERLPAHDSLYALDFLISNEGNPYLLEGNTGPGLNWNPKCKIEEKKSHELIDQIVWELKRRVGKHRSAMGYTQIPLLAAYN
jgi:glutathione synthase/RimK-type ligase-like ATP-grasp enzyme